MAQRNFGRVARRIFHEGANFSKSFEITHEREREREREREGEKEHSERCYKNCEAIETCIIEKRSFYVSLETFYHSLLYDELDYS